jgi:hypothetical protein
VRGGARAGRGAGPFQGELVLRIQLPGSQALVSPLTPVPAKTLSAPPFPPAADGRKVLRSSLREFLCSEAMAALGVPTTRAGSLVTSDTRIERDPHYDGNPVMVRGARGGVPGGWGWGGGAGRWRGPARGCRPPAPLLDRRSSPRHLYNTPAAPPAHTPNPATGPRPQERASVVSRIAPSFLRFGSFEIFKPSDALTGRAGPSAGREGEMLPGLVDYVIRCGGAGVGGPGGGGGG